MSYSPALTMGVWLGNNEPRPLKNGNSSLPGVIVNDVMSYAHQKVYAKQGKWKPGDWYTMPRGIQKIGNELYPSWYDKTKAQSRIKLTFDRVSKKLATDCTPEGAKIQQEVIKTIDPETKKTAYIASGGYDASKEDDAHDCGDSRPSVSVSHDAPGTITVTVTKGKGKLTKVRVTVNGTTHSVPASPGTHSVSYTPTDDPIKVTASVTDDLYYQHGISQTF